MRSFDSLLLVALAAACSACGSSGPSCSTANFSATPYSNVGSAGANANVLQVTVNGALCGNPAYQSANEPCASVTICSPSQPSNCQTIDNILVDTGSYGLRIFSSVVQVPLSPITSGSSSLGECVQFGDGSSEWGPVEYAYVQLGNEPAVAMPILAINAGYASAPGPCTSSQSVPDTGPDEAGFNGILGVGLFAQDCGSDCVTDPGNGQYFTCSGSDCSCGATVAMGAQVGNPVALLPADNNGVMLSLPSVTSSSGVASITGSLYLGVETESNNTPTAGSVTAYSADPNGNFATVFGSYSSSAMPSFIDSGSNQLYFPAPTNGSLPDCGSTYGSGWEGMYCPSSLVTSGMTATNYAAYGSNSGSVSFQIDNAHTLLTSSEMVFNDLGANALSAFQGSSTASFDWGLPFFLGKNVYVGLDGASSTNLGTGPYWAY